MTAEEFILAIRAEVVDAAVANMVTCLETPPGRPPSEDLMRLAKWHKSLSEHDRAMLRQVIAMSVDDCAFGFLAVLDGSRSTTLDGGDFELLFRSKNQIDIICGPRGAVLHELY
jgi:hypothetical protein